MTRRHLFALLTIAAAVPFALATPDDAPKTEKAEWKSLFNGKDLAGWTPKIRYEALGEDKRDTFRVADGMIQVRYDKYDTFNETFGHLFYKEPLSHYRVRVEYRFVGDQAKGGPGWATRNSGVMLHCQDPKSMAKDQDFPVSIEAQFLGGLGKGKRSTNNLCTPGTNVVMADKLHTPHCTNSKSKTFDGDQWVTAECEVRGAGSIKHFVNGEPVIEYEKAQYDPKDANAKPLIKDGVLLIERGYISLQAESHPIDFRKVEVMLLGK